MVFRKALVFVEVALVVAIENIAQVILVEEVPKILRLLVAIFHFY